MKLLPPADFELFVAHCLDKRTSVGGLRATGPDVGPVERKMEITYVKLGAAYYGMCSDTKNWPFMRLDQLAPARQ